MAFDFTKFIKASERYSSYYETGDDISKEADIMQCWLQSKYRGESPFCSKTHLTAGDDPPDFILETKKGKRKIGIEITELVDQKTVYRWSKGEPGYYMWKPGEILPRVEAILRKKEKKIMSKHNGDLRVFDELWLLLHTDEACLSYFMLEDAFRDEGLKSNVFSQIHFIMPPEPHSRPYVDGDPENHPFSDRSVNQLYELKCRPVEADSSIIPPEF